jgi:hypothetical protein
MCDSVESVWAAEVPQLFLPFQLFIAEDMAWVWLSHWP